MLLVPANVVVLGPWLLTGWRFAPPLLGWRATRWLGGALLVLALPVFVAFNLRFVVEGRGTPASIAATERLVVGGPFRWVRNPGYISVIALLVGQALLFGSAVLLACATLVALGFHLFVVFYEEPTLRRSSARSTRRTVARCGAGFRGSGRHGGRRGGDQIGVPRSSTPAKPPGDQVCEGTATRRAGAHPVALPRSSGGFFHQVVRLPHGGGHQPWDLLGRDLPPQTLVAGLPDHRLRDGGGDPSDLRRRRKKAARRRCPPPASRPQDGGRQPRTCLRHLGRFGDEDTQAHAREHEGIVALADPDCPPSIADGFERASRWPRAHGPPSSSSGQPASPPTCWWDSTSGRSRAAPPPRPSRGR